MLKELAKNDKYYRHIAMCICKEKSLADDLVNDMYIKLHDSNKTFEQINNNYIYTIIRNLYLDHIKKSKKITEIPIENLNINQDTETLAQRLLIDEALNKLSFVEREVLLHTSERSLRENEKELNIGYMNLFHIKHKALEKLRQTEIIKEYKKHG